MLNESCRARTHWRRTAVVLESSTCSGFRGKHNLYGQESKQIKVYGETWQSFSMFNLRISGLCVDNFKSILGVFLSKIARKRTNILKLEKRKAVYYLSAPDNVHLTCFFRLHQICRLQLKTLDNLSHNTITSKTCSNANVRVSSSLIGSSSNSG